MFQIIINLTPERQDLSHLGHSKVERRFGQRHKILRKHHKVDFQRNSPKIRHLVINDNKFQL